MDTVQMGSAAERLSLQDVLLVLRRHLLLLLLFPCVCAVVGTATVHAAVPALYQARAKLVVLPDSSSAGDSFSYDKVMAAQQLTGTYKEILQGNLIFDSVIKDLRLHMSEAELASHVSVTDVQQTGVLVISARAGSPRLAGQIVRGIADAAPGVISQTVHVGTVRTISSPEADRSPTGPNMPVAAGICFAAGLAAAVFISFLHASWHRVLYTAREVQSSAGLPVLGSLPHAVLKG